MPKKPSRFVFFLLPVVLLASCLHSPLRAYLDERVGKMSYEEAVAQWGPPKTLKTEEGLLTASWSDFEPGVYYVGQDAFGPVGSVDTTHGWRLRLTFEEESKLLKSWRHYQW